MYLIVYDDGNSLSLPMRLDPGCDGAVTTAQDGPPVLFVTMECAVSIRAIDACEAIESRGRRFLALRVGTHNYIVPGTMEEFERLCEAPEGGVRRTG